MGITVNMSDKEAKAGVIEPVPAGWYKVVISDGELKESNSQKNYGKPYYSLEFTIAEPEAYEGRKIFTNAMLFDKALYTISGLMKALGYNVTAGELEVPDLDELMGREVMLKAKITPERTVTDASTGEKKTYEPRNDVSGFKALGEVTASIPQQRTGGSVTAAGKSILP